MKKDTTYLVMKIHSAYAVLLDNDGRFIKAANKGYNVGDVVCDIVPILYPADKAKKRRHFIQLAASLAACVCLCIFGVYEYQYLFLPYGTVQMQINPLIRMTLSRSGRILDLEGLNFDGRELLKNYSYKGKSAEKAAEELADLAIEMNYLEDGGQIGILADSDSAKWTSQTENELADSLNEHLLQQSITVEIHTGTIDIEQDTPLEEPQSVTIPIPDLSPQEDTAVPAPAEPEAPASTAPAPDPVQPLQPAASNGDSEYDTDGDSEYE